MTQDNSSCIILQEEEPNETYRRTNKSVASTSILATERPEGKKQFKRKFTKEQLRAGQTFLTQQAATNQFASQKGMTSFGAVRHISDIKVTELYDEDYGDDEI